METISKIIRFMERRMKLSELLALVERQTWTQINISAMHPAFYDKESLALPPEMHMHRTHFCSFAKKHGARACFDNKARSESIAQKGRSFSGACPFGIWELAVPVTHRGATAAIVYIGGFNSGKWKPRLRGAVYDGPPPPDPYPGFERELRRRASFIAEFISTEITIWMESGKSSGKQRPQSFYRDFCTNYIERNYHEDIRIEDIASSLGVTPNFLSYRIRTSCGRTFKSLLTKKRLSVAAQLLELQKSLSVSDVAFKCGFRDANYFSSVFRRWKGHPPSEHRKRSALPSST